MAVSAASVAAIILGCLLASDGRRSSIMGSDLSSSMYSSSASSALCFVAARVDVRPFSTMEEMVAFRDLVSTLAMFSGRPFRVELIH